MTINQDFLFSIYDEFKKHIEEEELKIAYEVYADSRPLLYYAHPSLSKDKNNWIIRKRNVVNTFGQSSKEIAEKNNHDIEKFSIKYGYSIQDYALVAGSIPILNDSNDCIGVLTVTGLKPEEDHQIACDVINSALTKKGVYNDKY